MKSHFTVVAVVIASLLFTVNQAHAQAAKGHGIPDPITTAELQRYGDRLMLSNEQRLALQPLHDEYREQFRTLREGEIDRYVEEMQRTGGSMPGRDAWRKGQQQRERIHARIRTLDETLFATIEPILTAEQRERLPRVRMARQRARAIPASRLVMGRMDIVDLSEIVLAADLTLAERERVDPLLIQYEHQLTRLVERLPDLVAGAWTQFHQGLEEITAEMRQNPEAAMGRQNRMMSLMHDAFLAPQAHSVEIRALGRKTLFEITSQVSDAAARNLRNAFIRRSYMMASHHLRSRFETTLDATLRREDLDDAQRDRIAEIASGTRVQIDTIARQALEAVDEHERQTSMFSGDIEAARTFNERMSGFAQRVSQVDEAAMNELASIVPASPPAADGSRAGATGPDGRIGPAVTSGEVPAEFADMMMAHRTELVVAPISSGDISEYAQALGLDDDRRAIAMELHEDYSQRVRDAAGDDSREAMRFPMMERDSDRVEAAERAMEARRRAFEAVVREDDRLFDDLAAAFADHAEPIERLRLARERRRYAAAPSSPMMGWGMPSIPASIDLSRIARQQRIDVASSPGTEDVLLEYERELTALLREHHQRSAEVAESEMIVMARAMGEEEGGHVVMRRGDEMRETMARQRRMQERVDEITRAISDLHRRALAELREALPRQDADALLTAYRRLAHPAVYNDRGAMEQTLSRTLQMDDLTESQRDRLAEMLAEYRTEYWDLTERMREVEQRREEERREFQEARARGERPQSSVRRLHEQLQTLQHERRELNARTVLRLKGVLNEQQLSRLGPLPDPAARQRPPWIEGW